MSDSETKKHPASRRKLMKQREDGFIAIARDMTGFIPLVLAIGLMVVTLPTFLERSLQIFDIALKAFSDTTGVNMQTAGREILMEVLFLLAPLVAMIIAATVLANIVHNNGILFAMKQITPDLKRLDPVGGMKRIYGQRGWVETGTSFVRIAVLTAVFWLIIYFYLPELFGIVPCGISCAANVAAVLYLRICILLIVLFLAAGAIDVLVQRFLFLEEQKMTETELKQENKEQYGSTELRQERRRLRNEGKNRAENIGVEKANMCFFAGDRAVALRYHPQHAPVPRVAAKARGEGAKTLRKKVRDNGFPEMENVTIVESCMKTELGSGIEEEIFLHLARAMKVLFS